jgi:PAS domain S-box-containing protein
MTAIDTSTERESVATHRDVDVLLVDDRQENLLALEAILDPLGLNLIRAQSGEEALREVLRRDLAVILLDVQMPGMNGFETAKVIKSRERSRHVPIIFLTAISKEEQYVFEGYSVGAVDYLSKPFHPDVLRSKVSVFVDLHQKGRQLREQEQRLRLHERREIELQHRVRLSESEARMAEVVESAIDAIIMFDEAQQVTLFNAAAERVFGFSAKEAVGREIATFFPPEYRADFIDRVCASAPVARPGRSHVHVTPHLESALGVRSSGETFPIECSVSCLELAEGKVYTIIARDITERVRAENELREQATTLANTMAELKSVNEELARRQVDLEKAIALLRLHVARAAHADQRDPRLQHPAPRPHLRPPQREADAGRAARPEGGEAFARAGERRARPLQDRGGQDRAPASARAVPDPHRGFVRHRASARRRTPLRARAGGRR